jgi:hypothetical protein
MSTSNNTTHAEQQVDARLSPVEEPAEEPVRKELQKSPKREREDDAEAAGRGKQVSASPSKKRKIIVDSTSDNDNTDGEIEKFDVYNVFPQHFIFFDMGGKYYLQFEKLIEDIREDTENFKAIFLSNIKKFSEGDLEISSIYNLPKNSITMMELKIAYHSIPWLFKKGKLQRQIIEKARAIWKNNKDLEEKGEIDPVTGDIFFNEEDSKKHELAQENICNKYGI